MGTATTSKSKGDALELRIARLLKKEGRWRVRHNVVLKDANRNRSQIDVVYGLIPPLRTYVECKAYSAENKVPLEDVAKFKEVLRLNGISEARGLFVTTSDYTPRALTTGVRTVDGKQLKEWENKVKTKARIRLAFRLLLALAVMTAGSLFYFATPERLRGLRETDWLPAGAAIIIEGVEKSLALRRKIESWKTDAKDASERARRRLKKTC